ncbi:MAG TPA: nucleoside triphosphate pyrophosphohydrolase [Firmicutes bacterium]|nr:nucleoside triphosphate pyrophosphohydrolase [Bacillota bacterium]
MKLEVIGGESLIEAFMGMLGLDFSQGITILNALELDALQDCPGQDLLIYQTDNYPKASKVREKLSAYFPPEHPVTLVTMGQAGKEGAKINKMPLHELVTQEACFPAAFYVPSLPGGLGSLLKLMETLRSPAGCPWDREQDHRSLRPYVLEEAYEVVDAINKGDRASLVEELGDLLLQVVFHAQIAREKGAFNIYHVIDGIVEKIIRRHPHVFSSLKLTSSKEVLKTWQEIKEGENEARRDLANTGRELPALLRANKIQSRAAALGFDWPDIKGALEKLAEELAELKAVYNTADTDKIEEELGDVFFALVNVSRFLQINPEVALTAANDKFCRRFAYIDKQVKERGGDFSQFNLEQLDAWWEEAKKNNNDGKK